MAHPISSSPSPVPPEETPAMQLFNSCFQLFFLGFMASAPEGLRELQPDVLRKVQQVMDENILPAGTKEAIRNACQIISQIISKPKGLETEPEKAQMVALLSNPKNPNPLIPNEVQEQILIMRNFISY